MEDPDFWRKEKVAFLAICSLKGFGFWSIRKLSKSKKSYREAFEDAFNKPQKGEVENKEMDIQSAWKVGLNLARDLASQGILLHLAGEPDFPKKLLEIPDPPFWIFVQGNYKNLHKKCVAIVGTRKPSEEGLFLTKFSVLALADIECATVSGLALGIDQLTHRESIKRGIPTIAVLGTGILQDYPKGSEALRKEIVDSGGTIITEYLPTQSYSAENFVRRNRLQAALGDILIPAEWKVKSGTAHTVKYAFEYNRYIALLTLPTALIESTETLFAITEYNATRFEIPKQTETLITILNAILSTHTTDLKRTELTDSANDQPDVQRSSYPEPTESLAEQEHNDDNHSQLSLI